MQAKSQKIESQNSYCKLNLSQIDRLSCTIVQCSSSYKWWHLFSLPQSHTLQPWKLCIFGKRTVLATSAYHFANFEKTMIQNGNWQKIIWKDNKELERQFAQFATKICIALTICKTCKKRLILTISKKDQEQQFANTIRNHNLQKMTRNDNLQNWQNDLKWEWLS